MAWDASNIKDASNIVDVSNKKSVSCFKSCSRNPDAHTIYFSDSPVNFSLSVDNLSYYFKLDICDTMPNLYLSTPRKGYIVTGYKTQGINMCDCLCVHLCNWHTVGLSVYLIIEPAEREPWNRAVGFEAKIFAKVNRCIDINLKILFMVFIEPEPRVYNMR